MHAPLPSPTQRGLYLITPDDTDDTRLVTHVSAVLAQATWLQYRNKRADAATRSRQVALLLPLCNAAGVPLIVNDEPALAAASGAAGVHLGEDDGGIAAARAQLGATAWIGMSCYDDIRLAHDAARAGADYIAFGAFFPSTSKPGARRAAVSLLRESEPLGLPRVAIGGITPDNGRLLVDAGADLLAVISGVFDAPDPTLAAQRYRALFD